MFLNELYNGHLIFWQRFEFEFTFSQGKELSHHLDNCLELFSLGKWRYESVQYSSMLNDHHQNEEIIKIAVLTIM